MMGSDTSANGNSTDPGSDQNDGFAGGCLCGAVRYQHQALPQLVAHCHCVDCRKSSGTGHGTHLVAMADGFTTSGEIRFYDHPADSGNIVSRGFCPNCGSALYSTNSGMPGMVFPRASSLDNPEIATPSMVVYASRAPSWDHVDPALPRFDTVPDGGPEKVIAEAGGG
jgi:hypothetical protein